MIRETSPFLLQPTNAPRRLRGHKRVKMEWNGEYGQESCTTWECECGASESASNRHIAMDEWKFHLIYMKPKENE